MILFFTPPPHDGFRLQELMPTDSFTGLRCFPLVLAGGIDGEVNMSEDPLRAIVQCNILRLRTYEVLVTRIIHQTTAVQPTRPQQGSHTGRRVADKS